MMPGGGMAKGNFLTPGGITMGGWLQTEMRHQAGEGIGQGHGAFKKDAPINSSNLSKLWLQPASIPCSMNSEAAVNP